MLVRYLVSCKLLAWGMAVGAGLVTAVISHRAPHSIWSGAPETHGLHAALTREVAQLQTVAWRGDFGDSGDGAFVCSDAARPAVCDQSCIEDPHQPRPLPLQSTGERELADFEAADASASRDSDLAPTTLPPDLTSEFVAQAPASEDHVRQTQTERHSGPQVPFQQVVAEQGLCSETVAIERSNADRQAQELQAGEATQVTGRQITMRDATTNQAIATLTIAGPVESSPLPQEAIELAKAERRQHKTMRASVEKQNFAHAFQDATTGQFTIEAHTIEIADLASQIAEAYGLPIVCHESAVGSISAFVTEVTPVRAIRRLVEPFGFAVVEYGPQIVIGKLDALQNVHRLSVKTRDEPWITDHEVTDLATDELAATERIHANRAAAQIAAGNRVAGPLVEPRVAAPDAATGLAATARRLPPVSEVHRASYSASPTPVAIRLTATPVEIEIGKQAKSMVAAGRLTETIDLLTAAIQENPNSAILYRMMSEVYFHREDLRAAENAAKRSLAIDKSNPLTNQIYGEILQRLGQTNRSQHYLRQAKFLQLER